MHANLGNSADMKSLFDVPVQQSLQLVLEQVKLINKRKAATIKIIILCGGLGSSPYMKIRFDQFCEEFFGSRIQVVKPLRPWSAVCKGAALRGLEESPILSRRSRHHYGFVVHVDFNEDIHDEEDAYQDELQGKRAKNQMKWAVKKVRRSFQSIFWSEKSDLDRTRNLNPGSKKSIDAHTPFRRK